MANNAMAMQYVPYLCNKNNFENSLTHFMITRKGKKKHYAMQSAIAIIFIIRLLAQCLPQLKDKYVYFRSFQG